MNRYEAEGIAADAASGKSVFILAVSQYVAEHELAAVFNDMPDHIALEVERHNRQNIEFESGGFIRLLTLRTPGRLEGIRADVIYSAVDYRYFAGMGQRREADHFDNFLRLARRMQAEVVSRY